MNLRKYVIYGLLVAAFFLYTSHSGGPQAGKTGAPGENTCSQCHSGGNPQGLNGTVSIGGLPATIIGGMTYNISVLVTNPNGISQGAGFQMTALDDNNQKIGDFTSPSAGSQIKTGMGRQYHNHTSRRPYAGGTAQWSVNWTAPISSVNKTVTMYAAGNITDMDVGFNTANDLIVTTNVSGDLQGMGPPLTVTISQSQDVSCFNGSDGSASAVASGGAGGYTYNWSNGMMGPSINNVGAGTYTVTATDINNDMATAMVTLNEPATPTNLILIEKTDISCFDGNDGRIRVLASGNNGGFTYRWSNGRQGASISNLTADVYQVTATDSKNCEETLEVELTEPDQIEAEITVNPVDCLNDSSGYVLITPEGGRPPYAFEWSNGHENEGLISEQNKLVVGVYTIEVTDQDMCSQEFTVEVELNSTLEVTLTEKVDNLCARDSNGSVIVKVEGGIPPVTLSWDHGSDNDTLRNLPNGRYELTVEDSVGCVMTLDVDIVSPDTLEWTLIEVTTPVCAGDSIKISAVAMGGQGNQVYIFEGDTITADTLCIDTDTLVHLIALDDNGCMIDTFLGNALTVLTTDSVKIKPTSGGTSEGEIEIFISGGLPPYTYQWTDSLGRTVSDSSRAVGLSAGIYCCVMSDSAGCSFKSADYRVDQTTSNKDFNSEDIQIYPNPISNYFWFSCEGYQVHSIQLYYGASLMDVQIPLGQRYFSMSDYPPGIYFLQVKTNNGIGIKKIIKNE